MYGLLSSSVMDSISGLFAKVKDVLKWDSPFAVITDVVDILIVALLFYFLFIFFKGRKGGTLLIGILICVVLYALSHEKLLDLSGVRFMLSGVFQIGPFAIIALFQPEIRELLETIGSGSLKGIRTLREQANTKQAQYKSIDNICKAVRVMSAEKTGALIVIGRTTQLDDITQTGIAINSDVSDYLLRNLFYNKAPLHDGAVVIENNRIKAASCILPLPKHTFVENELGTRHRAAVGMSEVSDAVMIIVSEETGVISVAKESELKRDFTEDSLRKYLVKELVGDKFSQE